MRFDIEEMLSDLSKLNSIMNSIESELDTIRGALNVATTTRYWDSLSGKNISDESKQLLKNFDIVNSRFQNTNEYVNNVINNYIAFENQSFF